MKELWLVGENIADSPSPAMHNAALAALARAPRYCLKPTTPADLEDTLARAADACSGINVTAPYKVAAARRYADVLDDDAREAGAVNTVVFQDGRATRAANTDIDGAATAWRRAAIDVAGQRLAVVGSGGAARAVVAAARRVGAVGVALFARDAEKAAALAQTAAALGIEATVNQRIPVRLLVLAASALDAPGDWIDRATSLPVAVHDLRYGRRTHPARDAALARRCLYLDGSSMLLAQAERALELFLGERLPDVARRSMSQSLAAALRGEV